MPTRAPSRAPKTHKKYYQISCRICSSDHAKSSAPASKIEARCSKHNMFGALMLGFDSRYNEITVVVGSRSNNTICRLLPALWREHNFSFREPESIDFYSLVLDGILR